MAVGPAERPGPDGDPADQRPAAMPVTAGSLRPGAAEDSGRPGLLRVLPRAR
jgi:hypothetical protein